ncbi:MAG: polyphosphate:AMP phosphotransferase [Eubacterium sp.]|nr:polyphosphate:AMP phosphotransferase [Eubacterium sp.]
MLERIGLKGPELPKAEKERLTLKLGALQRELLALKIPVMLLFEGWDAAGKGTLINALMLPMDPRHFVVYNEIHRGREEKGRPLLWPYWIRTPEAGKMAIFDRSYYSRIIHSRKLTGKAEAEALDQVLDFEHLMAENGTVVLKFFVHIDQGLQKQRFESLEENEATRFRVTKKDWKENKRYQQLWQKTDRILQRTNTKEAPWTIIDGSDLKVAGEQLLKTLTQRLEKTVAAAKKEAAPERKPLILETAAPCRTPVLECVDLDKTVDPKTYKRELRRYQERLRLLEYEIYQKKIPVIIGFEGWDAGGKGGAIKRLCEHLDPRGYRVYPTAAPSAEELAHCWLWRFWKTIPKRGHFSIYDRTWYGRVMVEPIEGLCTEAEYRRAFQEINRFEAQLADFGAVVLKFWMHISWDEQERRFHAREQDPDKRWKITDEDWRNREKWDRYLIAADRMLLKTATPQAPWIVVEGNDKRYARLKVLKRTTEALENRLAALD